MTQLRHPSGDDTVGRHLVYLITESNRQDIRIAALENANAPFDDDAIIEALKQADNSIQKAIAHFSRTAKENK